MRNLVKAIRAQGYRLVVRRLSTQETAEWNAMVSSEIMRSVREQLTTEENLAWHCMVIEEELNSSTSIK